MLKVFATLLFVAIGSSAPAEILAVTTRPVFLDERDPTSSRIGQLEYRGGLHIQSVDPRFGGYSGLILRQNGLRLLAVSDVGHWLTATIVTDVAGKPVGLRDIGFFPMRQPDSAPILDKAEADAEALRRDADGSYLVPFERRHRIWRYAAGSDELPVSLPAAEVAVPAAISGQPDNGGIEALAVLPDGRWLLLSEEAKAGSQLAQGWLRAADGGWSDVSYSLSGIFVPTDAVALANGDVLVLERRFTRQLGVAARLVRVPGDSIRPGAILQGQELALFQPPVTVDNFEAIDAYALDDGTVAIWIMADDNQNREQRTLLMQFHWRP